MVVDHVSGWELGLGAGGARSFDATAPVFGEGSSRSVGEVVQIIRGLFTQEPTFHGNTIASPMPANKPVQRSPRIWLGGMGEKRLLRMVAKYADGWNVPFIGPAVFGSKNGVLDQWCEKERRDPATVIRTVNLGLALGRDEDDAQRKRENLQVQFGSALGFLEPGMLIGTPQQVVDRIGAYVDAGAEWIIIALRAPFDFEGLQVFAEQVMPAFD
jgi:alkanesulfonate monooxygenase SsuD/methylene tetrahydromethanopterin reductase-like flavin-dependent oxidoreductase (luciferase family)